MRQDPISQTQEEIETLDDDYDDYNDYAQNPYGPVPILRDTQLNDKIISSHSKSTIMRFDPVFEEKMVVIPYKKKNGELYYDPDGNIVAKKVKKMNVLVRFESHEIDFPIPGWFTDSVTSSILEKRDAKFIQKIDYIGVKLAEKMVRHPERVQITGYLNMLRFLKNSIGDSEKAIGGGAIEKAKTNITRSEQTSHLYRRDDAAYQDYQERLGKSNSLMSTLTFGLLK